VKRFVGRYRSSYLFYRDNTHVFLCTVQGGTLRKNRESLQLGFFPLDRLPQPLLFIHEERIKDAVAGLESVDKVQKIALLRVLQTFRCNPLLLLKLAVFSRSRVF
jgi:hypothetical protein